MGKHLPDKPKIIVLCGSSRFQKDHERAAREETLKGYIVIPMGLYGHQEGMDMDGHIKEMLDELHLRKIDKADEVLVINGRINLHRGCGGIPTLFPFASYEGNRHYCRKCDKHFGLEEVADPAPYIGESTRREIEYAQDKGIPIRYLEEPND